MNTDSTKVQLRVNGESLQELYQQYRAGAYVVNRRYQRKLVWSVSEKQLLLDSVMQDLPIPLILLAEYTHGASSSFEIIDGLQRLNAFFSFIENDFPLDGKFFNLESLGDTKYLRDSGALSQKTPVMDREACLKIVNYRLPVSTYRADNTEAIDEVFRRINSSGRKLSLQEIRQAGVTSRLANLVRRISAGVRGDATLRDILPLAEMKKISLGTVEMGYGIDEREVWWTAQGILEREAVRESRDEELVLDLLLDMVLDPTATTGSEYRNSAYGRGDSANATATPVVESRIQRLGEQEVYDNFFRALQFFREVTERAGKTWASLTITQSNPRGIPRYFHALFISIHELLNNDHLEVASWDDLLIHLDGFWDRGLSIPAGGGVWGARKKREIFDAIKGQLRTFFEPSSNPDTIRAQSAASQFRTKLQMSLTEQSLFELKQGFCNLDERAEFNESAFEKVIRTACAMANEGPSASGWIFFGVADDEEDAGRIEQLHGIDYESVGPFFVTGTGHELDSLRRNTDEHLRILVDRIRASKAEAGFSTLLSQTLTPFHYEGRLIWSLNPTGQSDPVTYDNKFYVRIANRTEECIGRDLLSLVTRFQARA